MASPKSSPDSSSEAAAYDTRDERIGFLDIDLFKRGRTTEWSWGRGRGRSWVGLWLWL